MTFSKEYNKHVEDLCLINVETFHTVYGEDYDKWGEGEYWKTARRADLLKGDLILSLEDGFLLLALAPIVDGETFAKVANLHYDDRTLSMETFAWTLLRSFAFLYHVPTRELLDGTATAISEARKDFCYDCKNDNLYWHAMTAKCNRCHQIIIGG